MKEPRRVITAADEPDPWKRMEMVKLAEARRLYRETTPGERLEQAFELSSFGHELREAFLRAER